MAASKKPSIVFAHGIWADGASFSKLIPPLQADGHDVIAAQYGLDTVAGDVAAVKSSLGRVKSPAILVAHWRSKPSWYVVATKDRTVQPELERFVARRLGATTSHVPMLSNPALVLDVVRKAANAVQKA